jgi:Protein of unknown function (DUF2971)
VAAQVRPPIVPSRLYRYRSLTRSSTAVEEEITSISEHYLYCAKYTSMNDPMEGFFRPGKKLRGKRDYKQVVRVITDAKIDTGFACFSETYDNVLMWARYAGNYTGICLAYSTAILLGGLPDDVSLVRLAYVDEPPQLLAVHASDPGNAAIRVLSQKQHNWAYEREWRVFGSAGRVHYGHNQAITRVFFGSRIDSDHKSRLLSTIRGTSIEAYMMEIDGYLHSWESIAV